MLTSAFRAIRSSVVMAADTAPTIWDTSGSFATEAARTGTMLSTDRQGASEVGLLEAGEAQAVELLEAGLAQRVGLARRGAAEDQRARSAPTS